MKITDMEIGIKTEHGLTITELMVAMAVGLIVSAAVAGLFLQTSSSNTQNNEIGYIQDNGRYALKVLSDDLEMSNFWHRAPYILMLLKVVAIHKARQPLLKVIIM